MASFMIVESKNKIDAEWDTFIDNYYSSSVYQTSKWNKLFSDIYGYDYLTLKVYKGDSLIGGGSFILKNNKVKLPPLTPYNSIIMKKSNKKYPGKRIKENNKIINKIISHFNENNIKIDNLTCDKNIEDVREFKWNGYSVEPKYTYEIQLDDLSDLYNNRIYHSNRKHIKKKKEKNIVVQKKNDILSCWELWKDTFDRQGLEYPVEKDVFFKIYEFLIENGFITNYFAKYEGVNIAFRTELHLDNSKTVHDWVAGANPDYFETGATPIILWEIINDFKSMGYEKIDLNGANIRSIAKFKAGFGGSLVNYYNVTYKNPLKKYTKNKLKEVLPNKLINLLR